MAIQTKHNNKNELINSYILISADPSWRRACWISLWHRQSTNQQSNQHIAHGTVPSVNKSTKQPQTVHISYHIDIGFVWHPQSTNQQSNQHIAHGTVPSVNKSTKQLQIAHISYHTYGTPKQQSNKATAQQINSSANQQIRTADQQISRSAGQKS